MGRGKRKLTPFTSNETPIICQICGPTKPSLKMLSYADHLVTVHSDTLEICKNLAKILCQIDSSLQDLERSSLQCPRTLPRTLARPKKRLECP